MDQQHATVGAAVSASGTGLGYRDPSLARPVAERAGWQEIDVRAVDTARLLAADAVQKAGSGIRDGDEPGAAGVSVVPECAGPRSGGRLVAGPGPVRTLGRAHRPDALHPVVPVRVWAGDRGPGGTAHLGLEDSRAPGIPTHPRRRDHHRATRPRPGCGRRNGAGRAPGGRAAGPGGAGRAEPVRPSCLCHRLRRRHDGGHLERGQLPGWAPGAGQPDRVLRE